jgi:ribonuclease HII
MINKNFDLGFLNYPQKLIAGVDEAGRGPLAGPVVAAAVVFHPEFFIEAVDDSKKLTEKQRRQLYPLIVKNSLSYAVSVISNSRIDKINILQASLLAMKRSIHKLKVIPDVILIDGNKSFESEIPVFPIVGGDSKSFSIAAASIIAKVTRDRIMKRLSIKHPEYSWDKNKGYPTQEHISAIKSYGPTILHRRTFLGNILAKVAYYSEESK